MLRKKELKEKQENELANFKKLLKQANRAHQAAILRNYIDDNELKTAVRNVAPEEIKNWLVWARLKADWYHPHVKAEDNLLQEVDKDMLTFDRKTNFHS